MGGAMDKYSDIHDVKKSLVDAVKAKMAEGVQNIDAAEMGAVVDMIKDLAQAEKDCMEACYYASVVEAMDEEDGEDGPYGYNRRRYADGRFAPRGRGSVRRGRSGYTPNDEMGRPWEEMYGYSPSGSYEGQNGPQGRSTTPTDGRMGYHDGKRTADEMKELVGDIWSSADKEEKAKMKAVMKELLVHMERAV